MRDGIADVVRRNNSLYRWLWGDVQQLCIVLPTLTAVLLLFATCAFLPAQQEKKAFWYSL